MSPVNFIDLAPDEPKIARELTPFTAHLGNKLYVELKQFRNTIYFGLYKKDVEIKNRFNIPISQLDVLKKAITAAEKHLQGE